MIGVADAIEHGAECVVLAPRRLPLLEGTELDRELDAQAPGVAVVPDRHGTGTNGLILSPPDVIEPSFGPDSRARHLALAKEAGARCRIATIPSMALDLDTGDDLREMATSLDFDRARAPATAKVLEAVPRRVALSPVAVLPVAGLPEIGPGDELGRDDRRGRRARRRRHRRDRPEDRLEGRGPAAVASATSSRGPRASELAAALDKDPRLVELILGETERIVRSERVLIVETRSGLVCANAGIDSSNVGGDDEVLLLPADPDASARRLRAEIAAASGRRIGVIVSDSFGRPWRVGQTEVAIGCAGIDPLDDWRGRSDRDGRELAATEIAVADQLAAAADLVRDKAAGIPAALVRGRADLVTDDDGPGARGPAAGAGRGPLPVGPGLSRSRAPRRASSAVPAAGRPRGRRRSGPRARAASRAGSRPCGRCSPPSGCRRGR